MNIMQRWEYTTVVLFASTQNKGASQYLKQRWPNFNPSIYAPETLIPDLNIYGEAGWELISIQPVDQGKNGDIRVNGDIGMWTNKYLCAFRRRIG